MPKIPTGLKELWKEASLKDREKLVTGLGFKKEWAKLDTLQEVANLGRGFLINDLIRFWKMTGR